MTTIPAEPGFVVVIPLFDNSGIAGLAEHPVAAWRIEADSGQRVPIIDHGEVEEEIDVEEEIAEGRYALQHPDGSYHLPDGERCDNEDAVVEGFEKRFAGEPSMRLTSDRNATLFMVVAFGIVVLMLWVG
jgi:hypothetical protein